MHISEVFLAQVNIGTVCPLTQAFSCGVSLCYYGVVLGDTWALYFQPGCNG